MQNINNNTVELQWLEYLWNHKNMFEKLMSISPSTKSGGKIEISYRFSLTLKYIEYSYRGDSDEHKNIPFSA